MDGVDARGQRLLQVQQDVRADAGARRRALGQRRFVQQLLEAVELDQQHHVLQDVALDERRELAGAQELREDTEQEGLAGGCLLTDS